MIRYPQYHVLTWVDPLTGAEPFIRDRGHYYSLDVARQHYSHIRTSDRILEVILRKDDGTECEDLLQKDCTGEILNRLDG